MPRHAPPPARHRQSRWADFVARKRRRPTLRQALGKAAVTTVALTAGLAAPAIVLNAPTTMTFVEETPPAGTHQETQLHADIERLNVKHECSSDGLPDGVIPQHAVVRRAGAALLVPFDTGWDVFEGKAPGTLVSVCAS
jgi:hypothetical protein